MNLIFKNFEFHKKFEEIKYVINGVFDIYIKNLIIQSTIEKEFSTHTKI